MIELTPAPSDLGLASPAVGRWFEPAASDLAAPGPDLSVGLTIAAGQAWRAPAGGFVSYYIATPTRPEGLVSLRQENGDPAFTDGAGVILFTLLPEVELRLHAMARNIPAANDMTVPAAAPTRPRIRWLAFEATFANISEFGDLLPGGFPSGITTDAQKAAYLGLTASGALDNAKKPVTALRRPNDTPDIAKIESTGSAKTGKLWAFDFRGRPVDPGAVAAWWNYLADETYSNLWAEDDSAHHRTAGVVDARHVHVVNAHEGPLTATAKARLNLSNLNAVAGSTGLYDNPAASGAVAVALAAAPSPDDLPVPRLALLPHGTYDDPATNGSTILAQWEDAAWDTRLARDFARVALVSVERQLVGLGRGTAPQDEERTRTEVFRNTAPTPYFTRIDDGTTAALNVFETGAETLAMSPVMDNRWGAIPAFAGAAGETPTQLEFSVHPLEGEGTDNAGLVTDQRILLLFEGSDTPLPTGAWVRVYPHGLDLETGRRFPQHGGGARVDGSGKAYVVTAIPDGSATPEAQLSIEALVVTGEAVQFYPELRYDRPSVAGGSQVTLGPVGGTPPADQTLVVTEQGTGLVRGGEALRGGETVLAIDTSGPEDTYALVDPESLDDTDLTSGTLQRLVGADDTLIVTKPAFLATDEGDITDTAPGGASAVYRDRNGIVDTITEAGRPLPTMERREVAVVDEDAELGFVGATPALASMHEGFPALFGHPGMPAYAEIHGASAALQGPAIVPLVEAMRERAADDLISFVRSAQVAPAAPADPGGPSHWAAVLETIAHGVAGDAAMRAFANNPSFNPVDAWDNLKAAIESATGQDIDPVIDSPDFNDDDLARSLTRMLVRTRDGSRGAAISLQAAIERAQDFIYLETPAIDALSGDSGAVDLTAKLVARLGAQKGLKLFICLPEKFLPGQPERLDAVRKAAISEAVKQLTEAAPDRVRIFTPIAGSDRPLYMASTTAIVDDAYVLVGSAHLWRRGLTFDSALSVAGFDESLLDGRPRAIRQFRRQLLAERLGVSATTIPDDPGDIALIIGKLATAGGLDRLNTQAFPAREDETGDPTKDAWNPDGSKNGTPDFFLFLTNVISNVRDEVSNAVR